MDYHAHTATGKHRCWSLQPLLHANEAARILSFHMRMLGVGEYQQHIRFDEEGCCNNVWMKRNTFFVFECIFRVPLECMQWVLLILNF